MRDIRKDSGYFTAYLDYQYLRIEKKADKLRESMADDVKTQRILVSMTNYEIDLLKAEFSNGASKENMKILLVRAIDVIKDYKNPTYEDIQILLSLAIILDAENDAKKIVKANSEVVFKDRLLNCFATYIENGKVEWDERLSVNEVYDGLDGVFTSDKKEFALTSYLENWYEARKGFAWYDSHLRDSDTYCGYWSFESAAISKMLKLNDTTLRQNEYFPAL